MTRHRVPLDGDEEDDEDQERDHLAPGQQPAVRVRERDEQRKRDPDQERRGLDDRQRERGERSHEQGCRYGRTAFRGAGDDSHQAVRRWVGRSCFSSSSDFSETERMRGRRFSSANARPQTATRVERRIRIGFVFLRPISSVGGVGPATVWRMTRLLGLVPTCSWLLRSQDRKARRWRTESEYACCWLGAIAVNPKSGWVVLSGASTG